MYKPVAITFNLPADTSIRNDLERQPAYKGWSSFERELLYNLNYARKNPALFQKQAVMPYLKAYPNLKPQYGDGLLDELAHMAPLTELVADTRLVNIARAHASDLGKHNRMSHESTDGSTTQQRFQRAGIICGSECINMGDFPNALEVLLSLLIDFGVQNVGHRKSLLSPRMKTVGAGAARNAAGDIQYTVIDLGCD